MDLETRNIDGELSPYCISIFDGKSSKSFYLSDYSNKEEMIEVAIKSLMRKKYNGYKIYLHNFSYFDSIFLMTILSSLTNLVLKPKIRDGRIINFPFKFSTKESTKIYILHFRDSYLLLPSSLRDLSRSFNTELKGKKYNKLLLNIDNSDIISIVLSNVIPYCFKFDNLNNQNIVSLVEKIGKDIIKNFYKNEWDKYSKTLETFNMIFYIDIKKNESKIINLHHIEKDTDVIIFDKNLTESMFIDKINDFIGCLSTEDLMKLGLFLIEFIAEKSLLFKIDNIFVDKNTLKRVLIPGINLKENILNIMTIDSNLLPMIHKPEDWVYKIDSNDEYTKKYTVINYGGYLSNKNNKIELIHKSYKNIGITRLNNLQIINTVNYLSSTKFIINNNVLFYIFKLLNNNDKRIYNLIKTNLHPKTNEIHILTMSNKNNELNNILKHNSQFYNDNTVLQTALLFSKWIQNNGNCIYFPHFIEWRGRIFTDSGYFSYQKSELAKSLLLFNDGFILNDHGLESLKVYTANCFGLDKLSYNSRIEWVNNNINNIINLEPDFIFKAEEPLMFLSCCYELNNYYKNPNIFLSRLPIYLDETCNGLQHLSLMVNDTNLAKFVNILKSDRNDLPNDVYTFAVKKVNEDIKHYVDICYMYVKLSYLNINRKFIKRGIMTIPYGATIRGIFNQLKSDHFYFYKNINKNSTYMLIDKTYNKFNIDFYLNNKEINCLAKIIHNVLYKSFPSLKILVIYLKNINTFLKKK